MDIFPGVSVYKNIILVDSFFNLKLDFNPLFYRIKQVHYL